MSGGTIKTLYDTDFAQWLEQTAGLLRAGRLHELDLENLIEEIESLGKSQQHELSSRLGRILEHALKLKLVRGQVFERHQKGWRASISRQQTEIRELLGQSPSLRRRIPGLLADAYCGAARAVAIEYDVSPPEQCPFTERDVFGGLV